MVTAKLFSFQVCTCWVEPVFFKVTDEREGNAAAQSGSWWVFPWWGLMSHQYSGVCRSEGLPGFGLRPSRGK